MDNDLQSHAQYFWNIWYKDSWTQSSASTIFINVANASTLMSSRGRKTPTCGDAVSVPGKRKQDPGTWIPCPSTYLLHLQDWTNGVISVCLFPYNNFYPPPKVAVGSKIKWWFLFRNFLTFKIYFYVYKCFTHTYICAPQRMSGTNGDQKRVLGPRYLWS